MIQHGRREGPRARRGRCTGLGSPGNNRVTRPSCEHRGQVGAGARTHPGQGEGREVTADPGFCTWDLLAGTQRGPSWPGGLSPWLCRMTLPLGSSRRSEATSKNHSLPKSPRLGSMAPGNPSGRGASLRPAAAPPADHGGVSSAGPRSPCPVQLCHESHS